MRGSLVWKFLAAVVLVALLGAAAGFIGLRATDETRDQIGLLGDRELAGLLQLGTARRDTLQVRELVLRHVALSNGSGYEQIEREIGRLDDEVDRRLALLQSSWEDTTKLAQLTSLRAALAEYRRVRDTKTLRLSREERSRQALAVAFGEAGAAYERVSEAFDLLVAVNETQAGERIRDVEERYGEARTLVLAATFAALLGGVAVALLGGVRLRRRLEPLAAASAAVAKGDLAVRIDGGSADEIGRVERAFDSMTSTIEQRESDLRESRELYRRVVENSQELICLCAVDGRLTYASPSIRAVLGTGLEELVGEPIDMHVHSEDLGPFGRAFDTAARGEPTSVAVRLRSEGTDWIVVEGTLTPIVSGGVVEAVLGVARDVTDRVELEEQLRQTAKMEAIGRLAGGVAHDFNNLLTAMGGFNELLLRELPEDDPRRPHAEEVEGAIRRAADLTQQLLAFSRRQMLSPRVVDVNEAVTRVEGLLQRVLGEDIDVRAMLAPGVSSVRVDPVQLEQVLLNLAVNARDAMPHGGTLTVETQNVELTEEYAAEHAGVSPGAYVVLAVSDSGEGMDADTVSKIFEPFFTTKAKGTGLGLATVHGIVKQLDGEIQVYSEPGKGTTFKLYFPAATQKPEPITPPPEAGTPLGGSETVLVVEDDEFVARLVLQILERLGYTVLQAGSAEAAQQVVGAHEGTIDLLLTDVVLPGVNGRRLSRRLRAVRPGLRVLFMSGYTENAIVHGGALDADALFIHKPFSPDALARRIRDVLDADRP